MQFLNTCKKRQTTFLQFFSTSYQLIFEKFRIKNTNCRKIVILECDKRGDPKNVAPEHTYDFNPPKNLSIYQYIFLKIFLLRSESSSY